MSRSDKKQNAARSGGICGRSFRLIFTCFGQRLYELCRGVHRDRSFAVIFVFRVTMQSTPERTAVSTITASSKSEFR